MRLPKLKLKTLRKIFVLIVLLCAFFAGGFALGAKSVGKGIREAYDVTISRNLPLNKQELDFSLFWKVWDSTTENYFDKSKLVESEMIYGAIKGLVASIGDPYTVFLSPKENKVVQEDLQGSFSGVGIQIGFRGTRLAVIAPLEGSPADKAGVKAGDLIIAIKDELKNIDKGTEGMTLQEAVEVIRGTKGTKVTLALLREGDDKPIITDLERADIDVPSVMVDYVGDNKDIAHIKVLKFSEETNGEWEKAVDQIILKPNIKGIVVDVRNNPGGYLQAAVNLASEFLPNGSVVVIEDGGEGLKRDYKVTRLGKLMNRKVVVLVNKGSASASEILAGAMRDDKQIKLIGDTTFGKGTIQEPIQVNGAGLHITTARWLTPNGTWVHEKGLEPDIKVEDKDDTPEDEQLQTAISELQ